MDASNFIRCFKGVKRTSICLFSYVKVLHLYSFHYRKENHKTFLLVYKTVSLRNNSQVKKLRLKNTVQKWLIYSLNDPIVKILSKNSHLTKTQLETFLIDVLAENTAGKPLKYEEKAKLRLLKAGISRGAFNRTLRQARRNVIQSIYTILLLGYLGVFEDTRLDPYIEAANKLHSYMSAYRKISKGKKINDEYLRIVNALREELETSLEQLSKPKTLSKM